MHAIITVDYRHTFHIFQCVLIIYRTIDCSKNQLFQFPTHFPHFLKSVNNLRYVISRSHNAYLLNHTLVQFAIELYKLDWSARKVEKIGLFMEKFWTIIAFTEKSWKINSVVENVAKIGIHFRELFHQRKFKKLNKNSEICLHLKIY